MTEIDYEARVRKGIALLDKKFPDWAGLIDLDILDINDGERCVTAQLAEHKAGDASYATGMDLLGLYLGSYNDGSYTQYGFNAEVNHAPDMPSNYDQLNAYAELNTIWKREIAARQAAS